MVETAQGCRSRNKTHGYVENNLGPEPAGGTRLGSPVEHVGDNTEASSNCAAKPDAESHPNNKSDVGFDKASNCEDESCADSENDCDLSTDQAGENDEESDADTETNSDLSTDRADENDEESDPDSESDSDLSKHRADESDSDVRTDAAVEGDEESDRNAKSPTQKRKRTKATIHNPVLVVFDFTSLKTQLFDYGNLQGRLAIRLNQHSKTGKFRIPKDKTEFRAFLDRSNGCWHISKKEFSGFIKSGKIGQVRANPGLALECRVNHEGGQNIGEESDARQRTIGRPF